MAPGRQGGRGCDEGTDVGEGALPTPVLSDSSRVSGRPVKGHWRHGGPGPPTMHESIRALGRLKQHGRDPAHLSLASRGTPQRAARGAGDAG